MSDGMDPRDRRVSSLLVSAAIGCSSSRKSEAYLSLSSFLIAVLILSISSSLGIGSLCSPMTASATSFQPVFSLSSLSCGCEIS